MHLKALLPTYMYSSTLQFGPHGLRCGSVRALGQQYRELTPLVCMMTLPLAPSSVPVLCGMSQPLPMSHAADNPQEHTESCRLELPSV